MADNNDASTGRPLFVSRPLLNHSGLLEWAKDQGFREPVPATALHVTVALSRKPIWRPLPARDDDEIIIRAGQRRHLRRFGGVVVLVFSSLQLNRRHAQFCRIGASWDHPIYKPHITFAVDDDRDFSRLSPYRGSLHFGSESYKEPFDDYAWQPPENVRS